VGLADAIISISPNPGGPGRTKIAPTGVALFPAGMRLRPIGGLSLATTASAPEMQSLAALPHVQAVELPIGKLSIHEEFPDAVAEAVKSFVRVTTLGAAPERD
jgi:hypothetical protein